MALTMQDALTGDVFHLEPTPWGTGRSCADRNGPMRWRRNGRTQTWKTRPGEYRLPVKHGLRHYDAVSPVEAVYMHRAEDCPNADTRY